MRPSGRDSKRKIDEARDQYKKLAEELARLEINAEGKALIVSLNEALQAGREQNLATVGYAMAGKTSEAVRAYEKQVAPFRAKVYAAVEKLVTYNESRNEFRYQEAKKAGFNAKLFSIILALIVLGFSIPRRPSPDCRH